MASPSKSVKNVTAFFLLENTKLPQFYNINNNY